MKEYRENINDVRRDNMQAHQQNEESSAEDIVIVHQSEESILKGGAPVVIPDFTNGKWATYKKVDIGLEFSLD